MSFYNDFLNLALSNDWVSIAMNLILSTIVGGIVLLIMVAILTKVWREHVKLPNAFLMVLMLGIINTIVALFVPILSAGLTIQLLIWIGFTKLFFPSLKWWHILVIGVVGYILSIFLIPSIVLSFSSYIPFSF